MIEQILSTATRRQRRATAIAIGFAVIAASAGVALLALSGWFLTGAAMAGLVAAYDVVIVSEHFDATDTATNPIIATAIDAPPAQRRKQFIAVLGSSFTTGDEMQAFTASVDLVIALADVVNLRPILRRGVNRAQEFYAPLHDAMRAAGVA